MHTGHQLAVRCLNTYKRNGESLLLAGNGPSLTLYRHLTKSDDDPCLEFVSEINIFAPTSIDIAGIECSPNGDVIVVHSSQYKAVLNDVLLRDGGNLCHMNIFSSNVSSQRCLLGVRWLQKHSFFLIFSNGHVEQWDISCAADESTMCNYVRNLYRFELTSPEEIITSWESGVRAGTRRLAVGTSRGIVFHAHDWKTVQPYPILEDAQKPTQACVSSIIFVDAFIIVCHGDGTIVIRDNTGLISHHIQGRADGRNVGFSAVALNGLSHTVLSGGQDGSITFWNWSIEKEPLRLDPKRKFKKIVIKNSSHVSPGYGPICSMLSDTRMGIVVGCQFGGLFMLNTDTEVACTTLVPNNYSENKFARLDSMKFGTDLIKEALQCSRIITVEKIAMLQFHKYSLILTRNLLTVGRVYICAEDSATTLRQIEFCDSDEGEATSTKQVFIVGFKTGIVRLVAVTPHKLPCKSIDEDSAEVPGISDCSINVGAPVVDLHVSFNTHLRVEVAVPGRTVSIDILEAGRATRVYGSSSRSKEFPLGKWRMRISGSEPLCYTQKIQTPLRFVCNTRGLLLLAYVQDLKSVVLLDTATRTVRMCIQCPVTPKSLDRVEATNNDEGVLIFYGNGMEFTIPRVIWPVVPVSIPFPGSRLLNIKVIAASDTVAMVICSTADRSVISSVFNLENGQWHRGSRMTEKSDIRYMVCSPIQKNVKMYRDWIYPVGHTELTATGTLALLRSDGIFSLAGVILQGAHSGSLQSIDRMMTQVHVSSLSIAGYIRDIMPVGLGVPSTLYSCGYSNGDVWILRGPCRSYSVKPLLVGVISNESMRSSVKLVALVDWSSVICCVCVICEDGSVFFYSLRLIGKKSADNWLDFERFMPCPVLEKFEQALISEDDRRITCAVECSIDYYAEHSALKYSSDRLLAAGCESGRVVAAIACLHLGRLGDAFEVALVSSPVLQVELYPNKDKTINKTFRCVCLDSEGVLNLLGLEIFDQQNITSTPLAVAVTNVPHRTCFTKLHETRELYAVAGDGIEIVRLWEYLGY